MDLTLNGLGKGLLEFVGFPKGDIDLTRNGFEERLLEFVGFPKGDVELSSNPIKSNYQNNLKESGWEFIINVEAVNRLMDHTKDRNSFRLLKEYCERFYSGKRIKLARAYNRHGERIPSREKIVAVYGRDRE